MSPGWNDILESSRQRAKDVTATAGRLQFGEVMGAGAVARGQLPLGTVFWQDMLLVGTIRQRRDHDRGDRHTGSGVSKPLLSMAVFSSRPCPGTCCFSSRSGEARAKAGGTTAMAAQVGCPGLADCSNDPLSGANARRDSASVEERQPDGLHFVGMRRPEELHDETHCITDRLSRRGRWQPSLLLAPDVILIVFCGHSPGGASSGRRSLDRDKIRCRRRMGRGNIPCSVSCLHFAAFGTAVAPAIAEQIDELVRRNSRGLRSVAGAPSRSFSWGPQLLDSVTPSSLASPKAGRWPLSAVSSTFGALGNFVINPLHRALWSDRPAGL